MSSTISLPCKHVSHTAWLVASFRALETSRKDAHFHDHLAAKLVGDFAEEYLSGFSPQLRNDPWLLTVRTCLIDALILKYVEQGVITILNLGAGLDTRPYRLDLPEGVRWYEADYADLMQYKNEKLANESPRCKLTRLPADLSIDAERSLVCSRIAQENNPTLILTEGLLGYLSEHNVRQLAEELFAIPRCHFWLVDVFNKSFLASIHQAFGIEMADGSKPEQVPLTFIPQDTASFLKPYGWQLQEFFSFHEGMVKLDRFPQGMNAEAIKNDQGFRESGVSLFQARAKL